MIVVTAMGIYGCSGEESDKKEESAKKVTSNKTEETEEVKKEKVMENRLSASGSVSAYVTEEGVLYMWGDDDYGQLGYESTSKSKMRPVKIMYIFQP